MASYKFNSDGYITKIEKLELSWNQKYKDFKKIFRKILFMKQEGHGPDYNRFLLEH